jgi:hypothetical protein
VDDSKLGVRNKRGDWKPNGPVEYAPVLTWPIRPVAFVKWLFGAQGFFLPWNVTFTAIAYLIWRFLTPSSDMTRTFAVGWIAYLLVLNALIVLAFYGAWHLRLYIQKAQGQQFKYDAKWPPTDNSAFLFKNQNIDNLIWTFASGIPVWTFSRQSCSGPPPTVTRPMSVGGSIPSTARWCLWHCRSGRIFIST